ncbi:MAG: glycosyltransferase, partial [Candidatus Liptonbacteria bacterium]|nr:glycosyltransferase [Candidatus Liptonbacteria bacterium]
METRKILFVGDLNEYGRGLQRCNGLKDLGCAVTGLSQVPLGWNPRNRNLFHSIFWRLKIPIDSTGVNKKIKEEVSKNKFGVVWIEKGNTIYPCTLKFIKKHSPETKLISVSEDDMYAPHNYSLYYRMGLKYYDIVFTTKVYNLLELKSFGAKRTELFLDSYGEKTHHPYELTTEEKARFSSGVGFAGSFEGDRAERMLYLAEHGIKITVWGLDWGPWVGKHPNLDIKNEQLPVVDYSKSICATKINLCFLRKINRDEVTSRSVEIPACGGFMLGERTKRHSEFFKEGKEAEFFAGNEEMLAKVEYYLGHESDRERIAAAGMERCQRDYS